jgi:glycosyltransferase involved in cell wall biosynthesis
MRASRCSLWLVHFRDDYGDWVHLMRVAVINWSSRRVGGIEEYVAAVIPALRNTGLDVLFWHEQDIPANRERIDVPKDVDDVCAADLGHASALEALRRWKPDVLYVQHVSDIHVERALLDIAPAVLFVHTFTGTCISGTKTQTRPTAIPCSRKFGPECLLQYFPRGCGGRNPVTMWRLFRQQSIRHDLLGRYQRIVTHSEYMQREMERHGLACDVIDYPVGAAASPAVRQRAGAWQLLFAGRMDALKGGAVLIEAMPTVLASAGCPVHLEMAGDGPARAAWEEQARAVEKRTRDLSIAFRGWLAQTAVRQLMQRADLFVMPSLWPEPFGSVGPMAGHHDVPVAAFDVGGISQWLFDGVNGHLAPGNPPTADGLSQAIARCLADPVHHAQLRQGARRLSTRFTLERHMPQLLDALAGVGRRLAATAV